MKLFSHPARKLSGTVILPGDKSLSHRAALFAALAEGESVINNFLVSGVTKALLDALTALGTKWDLQETTLRVNGKGLRGWSEPAIPLNCRNSATTLRLLAGAIAASGIRATFDGSVGLRRRPMNRIINPLREMGVSIECNETFCAPFTIAARTPTQLLSKSAHVLPIASAQVKSCLMLAALAAEGPVTISEPGLSRDHTERMLVAMGANIETDKDNFTVTVYPLQHSLRPLNVALPGDISAAAFLIVAALIVPESDILIRNVGLNPTRTGLLDALLAMGADISIENLHEVSGEPAGNLRVRASKLSGTVVKGDLVVRMIDEFPIFAVAAAVAEGQTIVHDAEELRLKESDRISQIATELRKLNVKIDEATDGFTITGGAVDGNEVDAHGDHRIAMSMAVAGLVASNPVIIRGEEIIAESFPDFADTLRTLGANLETL
jgi:3-phosphoshikimate 1-carboxyvinyltransferase